MRIAFYTPLALFMRFPEGDGGEPTESAVVKAFESLKKEARDGMMTIKEQIKTLTENGATKAELQAFAEKLEKNQKDIETVNSYAEKLEAIQKGKALKPELKSFNDVIKAAIEEKTDDIIKFARKEKGVDRIEIELKAVGDVTTANVTGSTVWGAVQRPGIIELPKRRVHVRQLLAGGSIGPGTDFYFMRQNGVGEGDPAPTAEGANKPQMDEDLIEASVKIETIAGWEKVTRKAMNNIPGFISFLQSRMPERLLRVEDAQVWYGNGTSPNLKGILTAGNFVASTSTATVLAERIIDDLALLEDTYERNATAIAMRPVAYYEFFKNKATGSGEYDLPRNVAFINGVLYISGIPAYPTTSLAATDYVVGDFQEGAQLLIQEGMRLEIFEQDDKNVQQNKVTVRIEETVALPVYGPDYFVKGSTVVTP